MRLNSRIETRIGVATLAAWFLGMNVLQGASAMAQTPAANPAQATPVTAEGAADASDKRSIADLEKLLAPIALYPDVVLAQALPASTVPLQVVEAARFSEKNPGKTKPPAGKKWELPVVNLLGFPDALKKLNEDLAWLQELGNAVIDQQDDVMTAIQNVRKRVNESGALPSNDKQTVVVEQEVIKIVPADPQVVYVPSYNPSVIYVDDDDDDEIVAGFIGFGVGMAIGACIWDDCDWHGGCFWHGGGDVDIDIDEINIDRGDRETNIGGGDRNVNRERNTDRSQNRSQWKPSTTARTEREARKQADTRARNPSTGLKPANISRSQTQAQDRMRSSSNNARDSRSSSSGARSSSTSTRDGARSSSSSSRDGAFSGSNSGTSARQQSNRGYSSRSSSGGSYSGGGRSGGASRGGGGGGSRGGGGRGGRR